MPAGIPRYFLSPPACAASGRCRCRSATEKLQTSPPAASDRSAQHPPADVPKIPPFFLRPAASAPAVPADAPPRNGRDLREDNLLASK